MLSTNIKPHQGDTFHIKMQNRCCLIDLKRQGSYTIGLRALDALTVEVTLLDDRDDLPTGGGIDGRGCDFVLRSGLEVDCFASKDSRDDLDGSVGGLDSDSRSNFS